MVSLHAHNEADRVRRVLAWLDGGEVLALVCDAGTPLVSDPGGRLVEAVTEAGHTVIPIPGPSAVLGALVGSGLPSDRFLFLGFPERKGKARSRFLERIAESEETTVLFESPRRLVRLLEDLTGSCGPARRVAVARELTKLHEEWFRGPVGEAAEHFRSHPPRGEISVVVGPAEGTIGTGRGEAEDDVRAAAARLLETGERPSTVAREVARRLGVPRNVAYRIVQEWTEG